MRIDDLIERLQRFRETHGNLEIGRWPHNWSNDDQPIHRSTLDDLELVLHEDGVVILERRSEGNVTERRTFLMFE
jgi:hypothetical protein